MFFTSICYPLNTAAVKRFLEVVLFTLITRGVEEDHAPLLLLISMTLTAASRDFKRAAEREMERILNYFFKSDIYAVSFDFEEIVPIFGHHGVEDYEIAIL